MTFRRRFTDLGLYDVKMLNENSVFIHHLLFSKLTKLLSGVLRLDGGVA